MKLYLIVGFIFLSIMLVACNGDDENEVVSVQRSDLYGLWRWDDQRFSLVDALPDYYYAFRENGESYYVNSYVNMDSMYANVFLSKVTWEVTHNRYLQISPYWPQVDRNLSALGYSPFGLCNRTSIDGYAFCISILSNEDSLLEAVRRFPLRDANFIPFQEDTTYAIIDFSGENYFDVVSDSCYQANEGVESYIGLCNSGGRFRYVKALPSAEEQIFLDRYDQVFQNVNRVVSSTDWWNAMEAMWREQNPGVE